MLNDIPAPWLNEFNNPFTIKKCLGINCIIQSKIVRGILVIFIITVFIYCFYTVEMNGGASSPTQVCAISKSHTRHKWPRRAIYPMHKKDIGCYFLLLQNFLNACITFTTKLDVLQRNVLKRRVTSYNVASRLTCTT